MRKQHQRSRSILYVMAAAPLVIYVIALIGLSADRFRALAENLHVVNARITQDATTSGNGLMDLAFPCQQKTVTATVTAAQLAQESSYTKEQVLERFRTGDTLKVGVNADCEIKMLLVAQPPFLVYFLLTAFIGLFTAVWAAFLYAIWLGQGALLKGLGEYMKQNR